MRSKVKNFRPIDTVKRSLTESLGIVLPSNWIEIYRVLENSDTIYSLAKDFEKCPKKHAFSLADGPALVNLDQFKTPIRVVTLSRHGLRDMQAGESREGTRYVSPVRTRTNQVLGEIDVFKSSLEGDTLFFILAKDRDEYSSKINALNEIPDLEFLKRRVTS